MSIEMRPSYAFEFVAENDDVGRLQQDYPISSIYSYTRPGHVFGPKAIYSKKGEGILSMVQQHCLHELTSS